MYTTLISASELNSLPLNNVFILDVSFDLADASAGEKAYSESHIKGAHYLHLERDLSAKKQGTPPINGRHPLIYAGDIEYHLASMGMRHTHQVIVYDRSQGMYAGRAWWMLRWLGHEAVAVLDGGYQAWVAAGGELTATVPPRTQSDFKAHGALAGFLSKADIAANLLTRQRLVIDARAPERYRGESETIDPVAGHIPKAINRPFKDNLNADGSFKSADELRAEFTALLGKYQPHDVVAQCGSGVTACHNILAMEHAGLHGAQLYPGSWSEWCADASLPVEKS